ncbi:Isochorismatase-like protein [Ampelomyces quisqualis]|uniref:Isochorismatase-like protein n=1 Tax=Ampelomyces quisqualis TaxID=50730 RepID=A0A6A5QPE9_AMPQU|nr:Isochorismatase-like protein [Ampelomyces quisqualis]
MLSRAVIYEYLTAEDALNYVGSGWRNIILVSDSGIAEEHSRDVLTAAVKCVKNGYTMIFAGFFASTIDCKAMDVMIKEDFELRWRFVDYDMHHVDDHLSLPETIPRNRRLLCHLPSSEVVYSLNPSNLAYAAFARVGLGKLGYIGDVNFCEEVERLALITMQTTNTPITISPSKSVLVIIDMQNFFLSSALGRSKGAGHSACNQLIEHGIPAARKAGIRIVWLNWGLTEQDVQKMPPAVKRAFGFFAVPTDTPFEAGDEAFSDHPDSISVDKHGAPTHTQSAHKGIGASCGTLKLDNGTTIDAGKLLMCNQWNTALYPPLDTIYSQGTQLPHNPDIWIHKDRMSGLWGAKTSFEAFLDEQGIKTLFFAGVNTDQCVGGTLTDAFSKGFDCILLSDGCGTTSPSSAQACYEYNSARTYGFCMSCEQFARGVEGS